MNRIQRVVRQCKKSQGGPVISKEELAEIVKSTEDPGKLSMILDLEIRYRKFTMTNVKNDCPQRKIDNNRKIENIHLLMDSQELGLKALATMEDLVNAITDSPETELEENGEDDAENEGAQTNCDTANAQNILSTRLSTQDKLLKAEFIFGMFEDGFYPGQMLKDCGDKVDAIFMTE